MVWFDENFEVDRKSKTKLYFFMFLNEVLHIKGHELQYANKSLNRTNNLNH